MDEREANIAEISGLAKNLKPENLNWACYWAIIQYGIENLQNDFLRVFLKSLKDAVNREYDDGR